VLHRARDGVRRDQTGAAARFAALLREANARQREKQRGQR
jgi:hypothetical protein